jgi:hypothetical protein
MPVKRNYRASDVNMLTAAGAITLSAIAHQIEITARRPLWTLPFFNALKLRIDNAFPTFLGVDNAKDMRKKTDIVNGIMAIAEPNLTSFHTQVKRDFKDDENQLDEILTTLGFKAHYKAAKRKDQEATIELIYKFDHNMDAPLLALLANIDPQLITDIRAIATTLRDANITQESAKALRGEITDAAVTEFNAIYSIISDICVICADIFKSNKTVQKEFSFKKIVGQFTMDGTRSVTNSPA